MSLTSVMVLDENGGVILPDDIRAAHGLKPGDPLAIFSTDEGMVLVTMDQLEARLDAVPQQTTVNLVGADIGEMPI